jgi:hypothetical protein
MEWEPLREAYSRRELRKTARWGLRGKAGWAMHAPFILGTSSVPALGGHPRLTKLTLGGTVHLQEVQHSMSEFRALTDAVLILGSMVAIGTLLALLLR